MKYADGNSCIFSTFLSQLASSVPLPFNNKVVESGNVQAAAPLYRRCAFWQPTPRLLVPEQHVLLERVREIICVVVTQLLEKNT